MPQNLDFDLSQDGQGYDFEHIDPVAASSQNSPTIELNALRIALCECWTLCNTLATLGRGHWEHLSNSQGKEGLAHAWKTCWNLCQVLYEYCENDSHLARVKPTLDLCREFCQTLFEIRVRGNEETDSVLRVSFELNNHLYNTHDRNLPEAFRERTLDFYITLCHRLMKQREFSSGSTDSLLGACWSLAEMLFSLRRSKRQGRSVDEELLGSTVQACWELCDLFREGWAQDRPSRKLSGRSSIFAQAFYDSRSREAALNEDMATAQAIPETPTTIFDDMATVAADQDPVPNILVLGGPGSNPAQPAMWPSNSSTLSASASSTQTIRSQTADPNLTYLKVLVIRAATSNGFQRGSQTLTSFVKSLSSDSFGTLPWQTALLLNYRKLVTDDLTFQRLPHTCHAKAGDIAQAVQLMIRHNKEYSWLLDLYRWVFGFRMEEAIHRDNVAIEI